MADYRSNFDRQYRVTIGQAGKEGFTIGEGYPQALHVEFSFEKTDLETQNTGKITIWNLNKEHLSELEKPNCVVALSARY